MERLNLSLPGLSVMSYDPIAHGKMRAQTYNDQPGKMTGYDCQKCRNKGVIAFPREDGNIITRECECMRIRRCVWEMEKSGLKNSIRDLTFDAYIANDPWQKALKEGAQSYAREPKGWLLLGGQSGSGKTHLCTAVCRQRLYAGDQVLYMPWREKLSELRSLPPDSQERRSVLHSCKNAQVLYIDDLYKTGRNFDGNDKPTSSDISLAFEILNHRYINHLRTIISTERTPQELVDIDEATGSRIIEAAGEHVYSIAKTHTRNYRLRSVKEI